MKLNYYSKRITLMIMMAVVVTFIVPEAICHGGHIYTLWPKDSCSELGYWISRVFFTLLGWFALYIAAVIYWEKW